jgi:hypothetical protein
MATVHFTAGNSQNAAHSGRDRSPVVSDELPLFRFDLRQLFLAVAAISALFAALVSSHGVAALVLLLGVVVIAMHVFATALGSKLRARTDRDQVFEAADRLPIESIASASQRFQRVEDVRSRPRSPWHSRSATALPWLRRLVLVAIASGAISGATYLALTIGYRTSPAGIIVGSLSVAVLCGWFAFLFGSFYGVFRHGFREALEEEHKDSHR